MTNLRSEAIAIVRRVGWFSRLPDQLQSELLDVARPFRLEPGETVFRVEGPPGGMFGICSGCMAVEAAQSDRPPQKGLLLHPGVWIGEGVIAGRNSRLVGVRATRPSVLLAIDMSGFGRVAARHPDLWRHLALLAVENQARSIGLAEDLMLRGSRTRLAALLLRLAGLREDHPPDPATIDATQSEIAAIANLARSVVSTWLLKMERDGAVHLKRAAVEILDAEYLRRHARPR